MLARVDALAERAGCSRSRLIEQWLQSLASAVELADSADDRGILNPQFAAEAVGLELVHELRRVRVVQPFICEGLDMIADEQRRLIAEVKMYKSEKKGRSK